MTLETLLADALGEHQITITRRTPCSGGCISRAEFIQVGDGRDFFVKSHPNGKDVFREEAKGLEAIRQLQQVRVPEPIAVGEAEDGPCLILEFVRSSRQKGSRFFETFGRQLAQLHQKSRQHQYGWTSDNFIGSTRQQNTHSDSWVDFFRQSRLQFQMHLARGHGYSSPELDRAVDALCARLEDLLDVNDGASLLHGDLWSGNYLVDESGSPTLIDPAVYFGHREAELSMTQLFGGFPDAFYSAYDEAWPMQPGWQDRTELYQLYHLLNHLNLFGPSYMASCLQIARRFS